ncbi:MAG: tetratricopeptide repeat protein [Halalkalicoccus sp.]
MIHAFDRTGDALDALRSDDAEAAVERLTRILEEGDDVRVLCLRSRAYLAAGRCERALEDADRAIEIDPENADAHIDRGNVFAERGDYGAATEAYDRAVEIDPENARAYHNRASAYVTFGDAGRVMADYDRAIELEPEDSTVHYKRANALALAGRHEAAIESFNRAIEHEPDRSQTYNARGIARANEAGPSAALPDYDRAIELDPENVDAYYNRAIAHARLGNVEESNADIDRAIALEEGYEDAYIERGNAYAERGSYRRAIQDFERASERKPDDPIPRFNAGNAHRALGDEGAAIEAYHQALERASRLPDDGRRVHGALASIFLDRGRRDEYEHHQFRYAVLSVLQGERWAGIAAATRLIEKTGNSPTERQRNAAALTLAGVRLGERAGGYTPPEIERHEAAAKRTLNACDRPSEANRLLSALAADDRSHMELPSEGQLPADLDQETAIDRDDWKSLYRLAVETLLSEGRVFRRA